MTDSPNPLVRRCPRLGGPIGFSYCMHGEAEQPCFKIVDCWWETFDIVQYLRDHLPGDRYERMMAARPKAKVAALVEVIEQARQRIRE